MKNTHDLSKKLFDMKSVQKNAAKACHHISCFLLEQIKPITLFLCKIPVYLKKSLMEMQDDMILLGYHVYSEHPMAFSAMMMLK